MLFEDIYDYKHPDISDALWYVGIIWSNRLITVWVEADEGKAWIAARGRDHSEMGGVGG